MWVIDLRYSCDAALWIKLGFLTENQEGLYNPRHVVDFKSIASHTWVCVSDVVTYTDPQCRDSTLRIFSSFLMLIKNALPQDLKVVSNNSQTSVFFLFHAVELSADQKC